MCSRFENDAKPKDSQVRFDLADLPRLTNAPGMRLEAAEGAS